MSPRLLRVLFFPVGEPPRFEEIEDTLEAIHRLLGVSCMGNIFLDRGVALVHDDEFLLNGSPPNLWAEGPSYLGAPIHGRCFLVGSHGPAYLSITDTQAERYKSLKRFKGFEPGEGLIFA